MLPPGSLERRDHSRLILCESRSSSSSLLVVVANWLGPGRTPKRAEMIATEPNLPSLTRLPLASEERLAAALAQIGRLSAELRLHGALYEIKQMLRRCDEIEHLLYLATP
jgi:hypothetical protein